MTTRARVVMTDCQIDNNAGSGVVATDASNLTALRLQINGNTGNGFQAHRAATAFCDECDINGNGGWQGFSSFHALVSIRDSVVTGTRGLVATLNSYIDLDCASIATAHACSLAATDLASLADSEADLWAEGSIVLEPGASISGCEHYVAP